MTMVNTQRKLSLFMSLALLLLLMPAPTPLHAQLPSVGSDPAPLLWGETRFLGKNLISDLDVSPDTPQQQLEWEKPRSRLQLEATATVTDDIITYAFYPAQLRGRMWDLKINVPIPQGTTFISAEAPPPFTSTFNGTEVSFSVVELGEGAITNPLKFQISATDVTTPYLVTHAWATWKNADRSVRKGKPATGETLSGDLIVQPNVAQWVVADMIGDVPFKNYDVTSVAFQDQGSALKVIFYTVEAWPAEEPLSFRLYIDADCNPNTGRPQRSYGVEYLVQYKNVAGKASIRQWSAEEKTWGNPSSIQASNSAPDKALTISLPYDLFKKEGQFCWFGQVKNNTETVSPAPPGDWVPNEEESRVNKF